jgi:hypothetical protein
MMRSTSPGFHWPRTTSDTKERPLGPFQAGTAERIEDCRSPRRETETVLFDNDF